MDKIAAAAAVNTSNLNEDYCSNTAVNNKPDSTAQAAYGGNMSVPVLSMTISEFSQNDDDDGDDDNDDFDYESQDITLEEEPRLAH